MSQVSKRKLDKKVYERIFEIFVSSLVISNNKNKAEKLINGLLTKTEKIMLAKRLSISFLLAKKYKYEEICEMLKVGKSTVWQVKTQTDYKEKDYQKIIEELIKKVGNQGSEFDFFDFLEELLPPPRHSNWSEVRRKQWVKRKEKRDKLKPF